MAGGYGRDIAVTVAIQRQTLALALDSWRAWKAMPSMEECAP